MEPTEEDIYSPEFDAVWQAIKNWDIGRPGEEDDNGHQLYGGATGTDVMTILNAVRPILGRVVGPAKPVQKGEYLELLIFGHAKFRLGSYHIGSTKVLMVGPFRVFVTKG